MNQRNKMLTEARSWLGTKFHHQGRCKKNGSNFGGCDCVGLIVGVMKNTHFKVDNKPIENYDMSCYSRLPNGNFLRDYIGRIFKEINIKDAQIGDLILFKFKENPQHVAMVSQIEGGIKIIHSYMQARGVVEHYLDDVWKKRVVAVYKI